MGTKIYNYWSIEDKIKQQKQLINIYERYKKDAASEVIPLLRGQQMDLKMLQKIIQDKRLEILKVMPKVESEMLIDVINENQDILMAWSRSTPEKLIMHLGKKNFSTRKKIDQMRFKKGRMMEKLKNLLIQKEYWMNFYIHTFGDNRKIQSVANWIQKAINQKNSAISLGQMYNTLLQKLKKDERYYGPVLKALKHDGIALTGCIKNMEKLGQASHAILGTKKSNFTKISKAIDKNMKVRTRNFEQLLTMIALLKDSLGLLVNQTIPNSEKPMEADSVDFTDVFTETPFLVSTITLEAMIQNILDNLSISSADHILPSVTKQVHDGLFLKNRFLVLINQRINIMNRIEDAKIKYFTLLNYGQDGLNRFEYNSHLLEKEIQVLHSERRSTTQLLNHKIRNYDKIILCITPFVHILKSVRSDSNTEIAENAQRFNTSKSKIIEGLQSISPFELDMARLLKNCKPKVKVLLDVFDLYGGLSDEGAKEYYSAQNRTSVCKEDTWPKHDDAEETVKEINVPTYTSVKELSDLVMDAHLNKYEDGAGAHRKKR